MQSRLIPGRSQRLDDLRDMFVAARFQDKIDFCTAYRLMRERALMMDFFYVRVGLCQARGDLSE
jgi:hypothetical protein